MSEEKKAMAVLRNEDANIIGAPVAQEMRIDPFRKAQLCQVFISPDLSKKEVYSQSGSLALTKVGLEKLAIGASMKFRTTDIKSDRDYCRVTVEGFWTNASGETVCDKKTAEIDLEVEKEEAQKTKYPEKTFSQIRKFKIPMCESKAKNRVIRSLLGLRSTYTAAELKHPFVFPVVSFSPDFNDPEIKRAAIQKFIGDTEDIYGGLPEPKREENVTKAEALVIANEEQNFPEDESVSQENFSEIINEAAPVSQEAFDNLPKKEKSKSQTPPEDFCEKCAGEAEYKEGVKEETGKKWGGIFCKDKDCKNVKWGFRQKEKAEAGIPVLEGQTSVPYNDMPY